MIAGAIHRVRRMIAVVRLRPFDTSTEEGRAKERYRRAALSSLASATTTALSVVIGFASVPITIGYLGQERYGLWMTMSSLVAMFGFADLGIGNGLMNAMAEAHGRDDREAARQYLASALAVVTTLAVAGAVALAIAYPFVHWERVFNVAAAEAVGEAGPATVVLFLCFLFGLPVALIGRAQSAFQEGFTASIWSGAGTVLSFVALLVVVACKAGLPWLVLALGGTPLLGSIGNAVALLFFQRPWLRPRIADIGWKRGEKLVRLGILFVVLQLTVALTYTSDNIVIAHVLGPAAVTKVAVSGKLFNLAPMAWGILLGPLWPAYTEALARGDRAWVKRTLIVSVIATAVGAAIFSTVVVVFGNTILRWWTRQPIVAPQLLMVGLACWTVVNAAATAVSIFLNGAHVVRFQIAIAVVTGAIAFPMKFVAARWFGVAGPVWTTVACYVIFAGIPMGIALPRLVNLRTSPEAKRA
jgi:O-antigen/teichoic acid export membrane protein